MTPQVSNFIHVARWIAALAVLVTHVNANMLVPITEMPAGLRGPFAYLVWFFYGFAHHAVVVFFVLSGFLVGGKVIRAAHNQTGFLSGYLLDRTVRIHVVLIPVLLITALLDGLGRQLFAETQIYLDPAFANRSGWLDFLANVVGLQDIYAPYFGTNSALWTLAHEYWYYVTFGLLAAATSRAYSPLVRQVSGAAGLLLVVGLSASMSYHLFGFALWLLGAAAAVVTRPLMSRAWLSLALFGVTIVGLRLGLRFSLVEVWWIGGLADLAVALAFANLLASLRFDTGPAWRWCARPLHRHLADFSYSLYALHMPVVIFVSAAAQTWLGFGSRSVPYGYGPWLLAGATLVLVSALAFALSLITEARTQAVRTYLQGLFAGSSARTDTRTVPTSPAT